jgi:hypothetical protein
MKMKTKTKIKHKVVTLGFLGLTLVLAACASGPKGSKQPGRVVLDNSAHGGVLPEWVNSGSVGWEQGDSIFLKSIYTVGGNQRVNGCYDLAKLEMKESLLSELSQDIKGELNLASEGISEGLDPLVTKSIRTNIEGTIKGLRVREQLFERYVVADVERVECFVQAAMSKVDYNKLKNSVLKQMSSVSDDVAAALRKRQKSFFGDGSDKKSDPVKSATSQDVNGSPAVSKAVVADLPAKNDKIVDRVAVKTEE